MPLGLVFALCALCAGSAYAVDERIRDFAVRIELAGDDRFTVEEHIDYDFGDARRHGILREIPVRYGRGHAPDYRIDFDVESVSDGRGSPRPYAVERDGPLRVLRIGDPDATVSGLQRYVIRYRVRRGLLWLAAHDELYWNATGNGWPVPIDAASLELVAPAGWDAAAVRALCFTGELGSLEEDCAIEKSASGLVVRSTRPFYAGQGLSAAIALPKGLLAQPSRFALALDRLSDYWNAIALLPILVFVGMFALWWRLGRDPGGADAIPVRYEPPEGMTPAEMGTVLDERVDLVDLTATILDLAVRGHLVIEEEESRGFLFLSDRDYRLRRLAGPDETLAPHEERLLAGLFARGDNVLLSELRNVFYKHLPGIQAAIYDGVSRPGKWFPTRPDRVRHVYQVAAVLGASALVAFGVISERTPLAIAAGLSGAIAFGFGSRMPRRTLAGRRAHQHILGFREFIERAERDRLERVGLNSIRHFERILPYAFVLRVADAWAERFADLYTELPDWYRSRSGEPFRARHFVSELGRSLDTAGRVMSSTPEPRGGSGSSGFSSGGGFSGGGFGGGGGRSW